MVFYCFCPTEKIIHWVIKYLVYVCIFSFISAFSEPFWRENLFVSSDNFSIYFVLKDQYIILNNEKTLAENPFLPFPMRALPAFLPPHPGIILNNCFITDVSVGLDYSLSDILWWHSLRSHNIQRQLNSKVDLTRSPRKCPIPWWAFLMAFQNWRLRLFKAFDFHYFCCYIL